MIRLDLTTVTQVNGLPVAPGTLAIGSLTASAVDPRHGFRSETKIGNDLWFSFTIGEGHQREGETETAPLADLKIITDGTLPAAPSLEITEDMVNWLDNARSAMDAILGASEGTTDFTFYAEKLASNLKLLDQAKVFDPIDRFASEL